MGVSYGYGAGLSTRRRSLLASAVVPPATGIFGFARPATAPTTFPGTLLTGAEVDATDASKWSRQNNDAALSIAPGNIAASGAQTALRFVGYTDEDQVAANDRISVIAKVENVSGGNVSISSNVAGSNTSTASPRLGWKQGTLLSSTALNPRISLAFASGVSGSFSKLLGYNLTKLLAQKWFIVITAGQSNGIGATAVADPALDTPVEGCVVFPGATNTYTGSQVSTPMIAVDPVNHQTLNGSSSAYGGGPVGSFCRELRKAIPADYTIVVVAANYAGQGFKVNGLWNKTTNPATAYDGFWARVREVWAAAPAGSVMGGVLFCGGESDLGSGNETEWASKSTGVPALFDEIRREPNWGQVPIVITEIGTPSTDANTQSMIALQRKLATGSGDALEYARCRYVPRPANATLAADNTHFEQPTHRQRGIDMAQALAGIVYNEATAPAVTAPAKMVAPVLTASPNSISVDRANSTADGGSAITRYDLRYGTDGTNYTIAEQTADPQSITGLTNGTAYRVSTRTVNAVGPGTWSDDSTATPRTIPAQMATPTLTPGDKQITVARAAAPADGGSAITSYDARYGTDGANWTTVAGIAASQVIGSLTNGTAYQVQTRAVNAVGAGAWSASANATPVAASTVFTDDFAGDGNLTGRSGWAFAFGNTSDMLGATTTNGMLNAVRSSPECGWWAPDTGSLNHYAQATLATVGTNGPLICVDVQDTDNWVGVRNAANNYSVLKKVNGTVTVAVTITQTPAVGDVIRLELRGRDLTLLVNGTTIWTGTLAAGDLATETRPGVVVRTSNRSPWIDNWRSDKL